MCGIVGIFDLEEKNKLDKKIANSMTNVLKHRGPDDAGIFQDKGIFLGHRRLSIIDLSENGHQPMSNDEKKVWITFNGEIYNFQSVKDELSVKDYKFFSRSDTEVIIKAYQEWGIDCLKKFNGMFAFALWDKNKDEFYLVRDRLGVKPLYYSIYDGRLIFSSEIKGILTYPHFKREPNLKAVSSYLSYRYVIGEETLFKNVYQLLPGHFIKVDKERNVINEEYWDINITSDVKDLGEDYYVSMVREMVSESVKKRLVSDVPVGAYLSGGLDSSVIVAVMSGTKPERLKTFTIGFKEEGFNEFEYSRKVAQMYNVDHKEIMMSCEDYVKSLEELIRFKDMPLSVPNEVPIYLMSKELRKHITVVLSGEGADEIFGGYGRVFRSPFDYERLKLCEKLPGFVKNWFFNELVKKYDNLSFKDELSHFLHLYSYFPLEEKKRIFKSEINNLIDDDKELVSFFRKYFERYKGLSYYDRIFYIFEKIHLPGLLGRMDNATMAASVEARTPFVDYELVNFMFSVPLEYKMRWVSSLSKVRAFFKSSDEISENLDVTKYLLRKAFSSSLPESVINRKKQGFPVPLNKWFKNELVSYSQKMLLGEDARIKVLVDRDKLKSWIDENLKDDKDKQFGQKLWMLLNIEIWMRAYFD